MANASKLNDIEKQILSIIRDNPEGITLPEASYIMDEAFVKLIKNVKRLIKMGLIVKKENKYFPGR